MGTALPKTTRFTIITKLGYEYIQYPESEFDATTQEKIINNNIIYNYQFDFYGSDADEVSAQVYNYISSDLGSNDLAINNYGVLNIDYPIQLTSPIDRDVYISRYLIRCQINTTNQTRLPATSFTAVDFILKPELD